MFHPNINLNGHGYGNDSAENIFHLIPSIIVQELQTSNTRATQMHPANNKYSTIFHKIRRPSINGPSS